MAIIRITELFDSRKLMFAKDTETAQYEYVLCGTSDEVAAYAALQAFIPPFVVGNTGNLTLLNFTCATLGGLFWRSTAYFGPDNAPAYPAVGTGPVFPVANGPLATTPLDASYSIDFSGVTEHITQSKETTQAINRGAGAAPDNQRAIGVTSDGEVQGCDRISPNFEWRRTVTFAAVTFEYLKMLSSMVGSTNDATFYTWPAKSTIFLGGQADPKDNLRTAITFKFLSRPNLTMVNICNDLVVPVKNGSEYLWVSYKNVKDANVLVQQPRAAYVERIVDVMDWSAFRIGT